MSILLSHNTALELLRGVPPQVRRWEVAGELPMEDNSTDLRALRGVGMRDLGVQQQPLNVLVARGAPASKSQRLRTRWFGLGSIPAGLMLRMSQDVYVAGPELCFVQMAQLTSLVGAVVLGCELCGGYSHFPRLISGFYERPPLTSVERLQGAPRVPRGAVRPRARPRGAGVGPQRLSLADGDGCLLRVSPARA